MKLDKSLALLERAKTLIPFASQTFSKSYKWFPQGGYPVYLQRGNDARAWDVDGKEYIDFICGLGTITLGYRDAYVDTEISRQLDKGIIFSLPHPLEVEVSELLNEIIPCAEMVRFSKTGSEVTEAAITLARAYTNGDHIAFCGYHGWHPWYSCTTERPAGVPKEYRKYMHKFDYNNLQSLQNILVNYKIACVIMEPMTYTEPYPGFLDEVKNIAHHYGALLIFDEMVTGFRWSIGGAQLSYDVIPDLATFGKGIANGMPLAALVGKRKIMKCLEEKPIFFSTTFGGECLSLAAAKATITKMRQYKTIEHCWELGSKLIELLTENGFKTIGLPCRPTILLENETPEIRSLFMQELAERGILMHSSGINLCYAHTFKDINRLVNACCKSWEAVKHAIIMDTIKDKLKGTIQPVFKRY